jgi:hypothetical protein
MRYRDVINRKLDALDSTLANLSRIVNTREPISVYKENINRAEGIVEEVRSMIENEPFSPQEQNSSI